MSREGGNKRKEKGGGGFHLRMVLVVGQEKKLGLFSTRENPHK